MKIIFAIILVIHGLIHFMGFSKAFELAEINQLNQHIGLAAGSFWLLSGLLFLAAAALFLKKRDWWWMIAAAAIVISQTLIFMTWQDARFGTIANIIVLIVAVSGFGIWNFHRSFVRDYRENLGRTSSIQEELLSENDIRPLPAPVQRYLRYAGVINRPKVNNVKITFNGQMRGKGKDWFVLHSSQYNFFDIPTRLFYMNGRIKGLTVPGYHCYKNGNARMLIKLFGLFPVVNVKDGDLNQAETVTIFNDMCMMVPASLIDSRIQWEENDSLSSRAIFTCNGISISAMLLFNETGQLVNFISDDRYAISGKLFEKFRFSTPASDYQNINGINICTHGETIWHYPEGEFVYGKFDLVSIDYNVKN